MRGGKRFGQNAAHGVGGSVDTEQRSKSDGQIYWFGVRAISSRAEGQSIESERHVGVVGVRRCVVRAFGRANRIDFWNSHHIPATFGRVAMEELSAECGVGHFARRQL